MKSLKDKIIQFLREGILKGELDDLESELLEREYKRTKMNGFISNHESKTRLLKLLSDDQDEINNRRQKLSNPNLVNSFGEYLQLYITEYKVSKQILCKTLTLNINVLNNLIKNTISALEIEPIILASLAKEVKLSTNNSIRLIIKSLKLIEMDSSTYSGMARYDSQKGVSEKGLSMNHGIEELLLKASESKSLKSNGQIENSEELALYLEEFKKALL